MPFGLCAQTDAMNHVLDGSPDAQCEGAIIRFCLSFRSFVCFFCTVTDFSAGEKDRGVKFCMLLAYYPHRSPLILVNFGSRGVTGAALLLGRVAANCQ